MPAIERISGWGRYPDVEATLLAPRDARDISRQLQNGFKGISRGQGRSYGDSALSGEVMLTRLLDNLLSFDPITGILHCRSGITLGEILSVCIPEGWFLPVLPGTQFVSVGGAIASDVHGKNHHVDGSFSQHVLSLQLVLASGESILCSQRERPEVFRATCGGMGLTGVITDARLQLRRISSSYINQRSIRTANLRESFERIEAETAAHYSVAWLDCMARGDKLGRSVLFLGEHSYSGVLEHRSKRRVGIPVDTPSALLNRYSMSLFNQLYYHLPRNGEELSRVHCSNYFFPLDSIGGWNRLYGREGFLQYQFVLPPASAYEGIHRVLSLITAAGKGSFLSVLKKFGAGNSNLLSFPMEGYTLTLDFKFENDLLPLLATLDEVVLEHGGRLYLAKDARMSEIVFKRSYPCWEEFAEIREKLGASAVFNSLQSKRLGL